MRFECDSCHARYKISDEKVRGRLVRFPCRKCEHKILIDGRHNDVDVTVPAGAAYGFEEVTRKSEPVSPFAAHEAATARARRPSTPARRRPPSVPPRRPAAARRVSSVPAAAGSAFAGQHPGLAPPVPASAPGAPIGIVPEVPAWHVSINDVPIGPIRLEEMAHKIDAGAVSEYSLVWRDGFDEWRPLATVPELMSLLHERRHSGPPSRSSFSSMPPFVETRTPLVEVPAEVPAAPKPARDDEIEPLADSLQPEIGADDPFNELSQPPAPIGPSDVFRSSPQLGSFSGLPPAADERVSVPSTPPEAAVRTPEPRRGPSLGVLALIISVAVFSGVAAFLAFDRYGAVLIEKWVDRPGPEREVRAASKPAAAPPRASAVEPPEPVPSEPIADEAAEQGVAVSDEGEPAEDTEVAESEDTRGEQAVALVPPPDPKDNTPRIAPAPEPRPRARRQARPEPVAPAPAPEPEDDLSDADQKLLDEFGSSPNAAPAQIDVDEAGSTQSNKPALDSDAVRTTVTENKARLQRCYERAVRGHQSPPAVRLDLTVTVAPSGRVKRVSSEGSGPGGLAACVEASVRRWRFPASSEGGPAKFPIVFSAN